MLEVRSLNVAYGGLQALSEVSLDVGRGEFVAVVGPNGAGKTTLFKTISGTVTPVAGQITYQGRDLLAVSPATRAQLGIAHVPEGRQVFASMTVMENLEMGAFTVDDQAKVAAALDRVYGLFPILREREKQSAGTMSGGEQQMLAISRALMVSPSLIVLDEPSLGLSPKFVGLVFEKILEMKAAGLTMLVVEQNAAKALSVADRGYVLELGQNRFEGTGQALLNDPEVKRLYLGG